MMGKVTALKRKGNPKGYSLIDVIAKIAFNVNQAYCQAIGDDSQVDWDRAEGWQRESCLRAVNMILNNPAAGPEALHEAWFLDKKMSGWIYGDTMNAELKIHPSMVAFKDLPAKRQAKDFIFRAVVLNLVSMVGSE